MFEWLGRQVQTKREWREHKRRVDDLPADYKTAYQAIEKHIWNSGPLDGGLSALYAIRELFEESAAWGRPVLDVTGGDVAAFAASVLAESGSQTWLDKQGDELNSQLRDLLDGPDGR
jgi:DNA-binding ferritin-like protein (Dps family)